MACDAVVALGSATVDGQTYFGHNSDGPRDRCQPLRRQVGRAYALGEMVRVQNLEIPQVRHTCTTLGSQPDQTWGYTHGVNEHRLAIGQASIDTRLAATRPGLVGSDLVRLALERAHSAHHAIDVITDLVQRHGMAGEPGTASDANLLIADSHEAYTLETAGHFWVVQEVPSVRAISNVCLVRQDWDRIAPGLAGHVIDQGWWPCDGSKVDFGGSVGTEPLGRMSALRRWGRATFLLEQQSGHIDTAFTRRLLCDHYEGMHSEVDPLWTGKSPFPLCQHAPSQTTAASMVVQLNSRPEVPLMAWCAFGPPCISVFFPVFLDGELPPALEHGGPEPVYESCWWQVRLLDDQLQRDPDRWAAGRASFGRLQAVFDQETDEFLSEAAALRQRGAEADLPRQASLFMLHAQEQFEDVWQRMSDRRAAFRRQPSL